MRLLRIASLTLLSVAFTAVWAQGPSKEITVGDVLAHARGAVSWDKFDPGIVGYQVTGTAKASGLDSKWTWVFDSYRFVEQVEGTGAGHNWLSIDAFDGRQGWRRDWGGIVSLLDLGDLEENDVLFEIRTYRWLSKDAPLDFKIDSGASNEKAVVMTWKKRFGFTRGTVTVDRATWLATEFTREASAGTDSWKLEDYRDVELTVEGKPRKFKFPYRFVRSTAGLTDSYMVQTIAPRPDPQRNPFQYLPVPVSVELTGEKPQVQSKWVRQGLVLINPRVNGKDIGWFILDSGAGSLVIDPAAAKAAGMPEFGQVAAVGIGGSEKATWFRSDTFELGGIRLKNAPLAGVPLAAISAALGVKTVGICGWDIFARSMVELDVAKQQVAVYAPGAFPGEDGVKWFPLQFMSNHPVVRCRFEDKSGLFRLDTGATNSVTFHTPAVKSLKLLDGRKTSKTMLGGIGGISPAEAGELSYFELGPKRFDKPSAVFATADKGPLADPFLTGNVGQGFLKPFRVVLDYPGARIAFIESASGD